jgi:hypothetical protein
MAFKEHPEFAPPSSPDATIWRYMDFATFLSLLDRSALFFVRLDKLAEVDPFEGYYTALKQTTFASWRCLTNGVRGPVSEMSNHYGLLSK